MRLFPLVDNYQEFFVVKHTDILSSPRFAGQVKRYHTWPTLTTQTVAEHTWNVMRLYHYLFGTPTVVQWEYMMYHDMAEIATGDLPYPVKAQNVELAAQITEIEVSALRKMGPWVADSQLYNDKEFKVRFKIADNAEMLEFGLVELKMGNQYARPIVLNMVRAIHDLADKLNSPITVRNYVDHKVRTDPLFKMAP